MTPAENGGAGEMKGVSMNEEIEQVEETELPEFALMIDLPD
ncbi:hypothetical protein ACWDYJ_32805 [Streptomyces sp. NPDC003042]